MTDGESEGGDYDEVICAGWGEPGGEWTEERSFVLSHVWLNLLNIVNETVQVLCRSRSMTPRAISLNRDSAVKVQDFLTSYDTIMARQFNVNW